jgi:hypothetical protein
MVGRLFTMGLFIGRVDDDNGSEGSLTQHGLVSAASAR